MFRISSATALLCLLATGSVFAQWVDVKDPDELRDLYSDRKITATTEDGKVWNIIVSKSNGHGFGSSPRGSEWTRDWVIKGDQSCAIDHVAGVPDFLVCRTVQRNTTLKGQYRSLEVSPTQENNPFKTPKILNLKVVPAPDFRKGDSKATG